VTIRLGPVTSVSIEPPAKPRGSQAVKAIAHYADNTTSELGAGRAALRGR
jgi:hypothetical protein